MILSTEVAAWSGTTPLVLATASVLAYLAAAWPAPRSPVSAIALLAGWTMHLVLLALDIGGWGQHARGVRLGFAPMLSTTAWLVIAVHAIESRFVPLPAVRRVLAAIGAAAVALAWLFPGVAVPVTSPWASLHFALGVGCYGLFGAAVLHALLLDSAERRLREPAPTPGHGAFGMPLLQLERLTFRFVEAGFALLTATLALSVLTLPHWRWDHKAVFSMLAWAVFAALLAGRAWRGWRGRQATRWLYGGVVLLLLAYVGSRFVLEVLLQRPR